MRLPAAPVLPALALAAASLWIVALFAAPAALPEGTVVGLTGSANAVDNFDVWRELPLPHALVYGVGDLLCHQMASRSLLVTGNQMPVDARMTGIFAAAVVGLAMAVRPALPRAPWYLGEALLDAAAVPARWRPTSRMLQGLVTLGVVGIALMPAAVDVFFTSLTGVYDSTIPRRLWTGAVAGVAGGLTLGAALRVMETTLRALAKRTGLAA